MKYILIIVICFLGLTATSQVQKQGRSNFPTVVDSSLAIGKNFILPVFRSFSQLSTYTALDSSGRLVFIRDSNAVFYRTNAHTWAKLSTGSGSGSVAWGSITGTLSNQTDLQTVLDSKVDSVILRGGDSLYNHYATGEVQFIGLLSGGASNDTLRVRTPLKVTSNNDTLYQNQVSDVDSGWVSPDQKAFWDLGGVAYNSVSYYISGSDTLGFILTNGAGGEDTTLYVTSGGGSVNIGNSDLVTPPTVDRTLTLLNNSTFSIVSTSSDNDLTFKIDPVDGTMSFPAGAGGQFVVNKQASPVMKVRGDAEIDSLRIGTTDKIGVSLNVAGGIVTDSIRIGNDWFFTKKITLTPTDINSLNTTSVLAIPPPGADKAIEVISASSRKVYASTPYDNPAVFSLSTADNGDGLIGSFPTLLVENAVSASCLLNRTADTIELNFLEDAGIYLKADVDNANGDSPINIYLYYRIISL